MSHIIFRFLTYRHIYFLPWTYLLSVKCTVYQEMKDKESLFVGYSIFLQPGFIWNIKWIMINSQSDMIQYKKARWLGLFICTCSTTSLHKMATYGRNSWQEQQGRLPQRHFRLLLVLAVLAVRDKHTWRKWAKRPNSGCSSSSSAASSSSDGASSPPCSTSVSIRTLAAGRRRADETCLANVSPASLAC